jgi:hypothetical protein
MPCLFGHRWRFEFRLHYVYRRCQFCNEAERHLRNRNPPYTAWEPVKERSNAEPEQRQIVRKRSRMFARLARSLRLMGAKMNGGARALARLT